MRIPAYGHRSCLWGTESNEWSMQYSLFPHIPPNEGEHFRQNYLVRVRSRQQAELGHWAHFRE